MFLEAAGASKNLKFVSGRNPAASKNFKPVLVDSGKRGRNENPHNTGLRFLEVKKSFFEASAWTRFVSFFP